MEQVFQWVKSITSYLIFMTAVTGLLPDHGYEKYFRFFGGMVLILLVLQPLTGGLNLEEKIAWYFQSNTFEQEAGELRQKLTGMEDERLEAVAAAYEEAVEEDLAQMAQAEGFVYLEGEAVIETDSQSPDFGKIRQILLVLGKNGEERQGGSAVEKIEVEAVNASAKSAGTVEKNIQNQETDGLKRKIGEYYEVEEGNIEIQLEDGEG